MKLGREEVQPLSQVEALSGLVPLPKGSQILLLSVTRRERFCRSRAVKEG